MAGPLSEQIPIPGQAPASPTMTPQVLAQLMKVLSAGKQAPPAGGSNMAPAPVTAGMVGQVGGAPPIPQPFGSPSAQGTSAQGAGAQGAPPSQSRPQATQLPMPNQRVEYDTPKAARAGQINDLIGSVTNIVNQKSQQRQAQVTRKAENDFSQLMTALQNGDQKTVDLITGDEKTMKGIEKGLDYYFPREPAKQQETKKPKEAPPEAHGIKAAVQKLKDKMSGGGAAGQQQPQGARAMPQPGASSQLAAMIENAKKNAAQKDPHALAQMAGLAPSPSEELKADTELQKLSSADALENKKILSASQLEIAKAQYELQKQDLANQGRYDATTAVARIAGQSRVDAAKIMAAASAQRIMSGKMTKEPSATMQNKWQMYQNASTALDGIMKGDTSQGSYNNFVQNLKQAGLSSVASIVPGQGGGTKAIGGYIKPDEKWKAVQKSLSESSDSLKKALQKSYPGWDPSTSMGKPEAGGGSGSSLDDEIMSAIGAK